MSCQGSRTKIDFISTPPGLYSLQLRLSAFNRHATLKASTLTQSRGQACVSAEPNTALIKILTARVQVGVGQTAVVFRSLGGKTQENADSVLISS